jgi:hypothetical protein
MPYLDATFFGVTERADEGALARLGAAAVVHWNRLDPDIQRDLLALAPLLAGVGHAPGCEDALARLIRANSHAPIRRPEPQVAPL